MTGGQSSAGFTAKDGVVVVVDTTAVVSKVVQLVEKLDDVESVTWVAQFWVVSMAESDLRDLGIDATPAVSVAAALAGASGSMGVPLPGTGTAAAVGLDVALRAIASGQRGKLIADPLVVLVDGGEAHLHRGTRQTLKQQNVQTGASGVVTTTQLQQIPAGLVLDVACREVSTDRCRLTVDLELSEVLNIQDGLPTMQVESFDSEADLVAGGVYLLGGLRRSQSSEIRSKWLQWGNRFKDERSTLQVWCRVYRVASGLVVPLPAECPNGESAGLVGGWTAARGGTVPALQIVEP